MRFVLSETLLLLIAQLCPIVNGFPYEVRIVFSLVPVIPSEMDLS